MFCPDCGTQCDSKFCPNCGKDLQPNIEKPVQREFPPLNKPYYYEANGKKVDLNKVICNYGMGWRKIGAYAYLISELGISKEEAKSILDPVYAAHAGEKISYGQSLKASFSMAAEEQREEQNAKLQERKEREQKKVELEESGVVYCPKCLSTSVTATKRGFSAGQAFVGGPLFGAVGANKIQCVCLKCGHKWKP